MGQEESRIEATSRPRLKYRKTSCHLRQSDYLRLQFLAGYTGMSTSALIKVAVSSWLEQHPMRIVMDELVGDQLNSSPEGL